MVSFRAPGGVVDLIGQTVSHYRIIRRLGGGGMGVVYEAEDLRLRRHVALKFLPETLAHNEEALHRFRREARAASSLNHPNICTIHEIEEHEGQPVIVMELIQGCTLKQRLAEGPVPVDELVKLAAEICDGLDAAHARGIVHRDIKPANIFVTTRKTAKVLDFGLAKLIPQPVLNADANGTPLESEDSVSMAGMIRGTTHYMSPEQARGDELDRRSDLFSLGTVLYEMATGQKPFTKKNSILTIDAILNAQAVRVSKLNPKIPEALDAVIAKALEKDRERRYQTAAEMSEDLTRHRPGTPAEPRGPRPAGVGANPSSPAKAAPVIANKRKLRTFVVAGAVIAIFLVVTGYFLIRSKRPTALSEKDTIVLADFDNKTGDPVFDDTLKQALAVDLGQSPFLNILSERRAAATMRLMGRSADQPVMGEVARELCQRVGSKAMLAGTITALGNHYAIGVDAINCATGDALVKQQVEANGKEDVLKALGKAATGIREELGESLASVQKFATPIEEATTQSLEALKAYSLGRRQTFQGADMGALPYYVRAAELDPKFALAYRAMAVSYANLGQATRATESVMKAYELRDRVSDRERFLIEGYYYSIAKGDLEKGKQVYVLWEQNYPRDSLPYGNHGDNCMRMGQWEEALRTTREAIRLEPNLAVAYSNVAWTQLALKHEDEAEKAVEQALARKIDSYFIRLVLYEMAFLRNDAKGMQEQMAWASGRSGEEDWLLSTQSDTEAYHGRLMNARKFSRSAEESALHASAKETAALWRANAALREAEFGNAALARQYAVAAIELMPGRDVTTIAALAFARVGDAAQAQKEADKLNRQFPENTVVQRYWLPAIEAAIAINADKADKALEYLQAAAPYELGQCEPFQVGMMWPVYLRGQAYLLARQSKEAAEEFQRVLDNRGIVLNYPLGALARLGLARAYALQGDTSKAREAYAELLTLWKESDRDIPVITQALAEAAKLQ